MRSPRRRSSLATARRLLVVLVAAAVLLPHPGEAGQKPFKSKLRWALRLGACETPRVFYSAAHVPGARPCCPTVEGMCAGGTACPPSGVCASDGRACQPAPIASRPNVILVISDDQGACHYPGAGECRSGQTGTPVPTPAMPGLDVLEAYGTTFPVAHNTAAWCFPSLNTILTGRYQRNFASSHRIGSAHPTVSKVVRSLGDLPGIPPDPYNAGNRIGGYCTFLGGKFAASTGDDGFDASARGRKLGRTTCAGELSPDGQPRCGSEAGASYDPRRLTNMAELFEFLDSMLHRVPDTDPAVFNVQHFFAWYAPRIPHQPLRAPAPIGQYLFGLTPPGLGGVVNLGQYCAGGACAPTVKAFTESYFGSLRDFYGSMWWLDDGIREIRKYLARAGAPHCIGTDGFGDFDVPEAQCTGTWAAAVTPDLLRNTVILYLSDNGWFLPNSKHGYSENGYRTRVVVFDPRTLPEVPDWDPRNVVVPPERTESRALVHSTDVLPTVLGFALDTPGAQACPVTTSDGRPCDGKDIRPYLATAPGGPAAPETLRRSLCGHQTIRGQAPTNNRFMLTGPFGTGRCTDLDAPACAAPGDCAATEACIGGHCMPADESPCATDTQCPGGAVCLGGRCRPAPTCVDDAGCAALLSGRNAACVEKGTMWCRNAPGTACTRHDQCPACPAGPAGTPPCGRVCEARALKLYVDTAGVGGPPNVQLTELFLDPDEVDLRGKTGSLVWDMSAVNGPYGSTIARLNCCLDDWWPAIASQYGTTCSGGCPDEVRCTE